MTRAVLTVLAVLVLTACGPVTAGDDVAPPEGSPPLAQPTPPPDVFAGSVTRISDGDTLWVEVTETAVPGVRPGDERKLRLLRIDTPELARDGDAAECFADEATAALRGLAPVGSRIVAAFDREQQDRFDRDLVHLWNEGGTWVNGALLLGGYAEALTIAPNDAHSAEVFAYEATARDAGLGIWAC